MKNLNRPRVLLPLSLAALGWLAALSGCSGGDDKGEGSGNGTGSTSGTGASQGDPGTIDVGNGNGGGDGGAGPITDTCAEQTYIQNLVAEPLDVFFVFDRTASMGEDCAYEAGAAPEVDSKACYATYAMSDYLTGVAPVVDTRLAFQFMSLSDDDCDGAQYATPAIGLQTLPVAASSPLIQLISDEQFQGGYGTHIEGALRGIAQFTRENVTEGRTMIGVLMTDGDPNGCEEDIGSLASLISEHLDSTGLRTFIIGMEGATDRNLEALAVAGGADAHDDWCGGADSPCHYWNVGNGSGSAIATALTAIISQAVPMPCEIDTAELRDTSDGAAVDWNKVNVTYTDGTDKTIIGQVPDEESCPADQAAWYYDDPENPKQIRLCDVACSMVTNSPTGSRVNLAVGCQGTVVIDIPK